MRKIKLKHTYTYPEDHAKINKAVKKRKDKGEKGIAQQDIIRELLNK